MKNFLSVLGFFLVIGAIFAFSPRFGTQAKSDNTGRVITYGYTEPTYAAVMLHKPNASYTYSKITLTGALLDSVNVGRAKVCDELCLMYNATGAARVVTFGNGFTSAGTLTVDSGQVATATFVFNGSKYIEKSRAKE